MGQKPFLFVGGLQMNLGAKFRTEIELLSLTTLHKTISPLRNLLNKKSTPKSYRTFSQKLRLIYRTDMLGADS